MILTTLVLPSIILVLKINFMILSVHSIFGAMTASLVPAHPVAGFALGFVGHFVLDAIPHRDYELSSLELGSDKKYKNISVQNLINKKIKLFRDLFWLSIDVLVGLCLAFMFFYNFNYPWAFLFGVAGALLPDFIIFIYLTLWRKPLSFFNKFHSDIVHSKFILNLGQISGVILQFFTLVILIGILFGLRYILV